MKPKFDWFMGGMLVAVLAASLFPEPGAHGGALKPELLNKLGVALIFFLHGLSLPFAALRQGTLRWPIHLVIQACTFVVFPLVGLTLLWSVGRVLPDDLWLGFFFLCALPSTVSSSVALTAAARGNVPVAVFNATLSSLIGVVLTPLWISAILTTSGQAMPLGPVVLDLVKWLVLPLALGQLARPGLGPWAARHKRSIHLVDRLTILLLIYTSFCDSVVEGVWTRHGAAAVVYALAGTLVLFWIVFAIVSGICRLMRLPGPDRTAVIFCGSKKTLASGIPMARVIFSGHPGLSLILLPIMIYHPLQLIICSALATRWAREAGDA